MEKVKKSQKKNHKRSSHPHNKGSEYQKARHKLKDNASNDKPPISLKPDGARSHYYKAVSLTEVERDEEAIASYDKAISLGLRFAEGYFYKGNALYGLERYQEALWTQKNVFLLI